jgi:hypothetical protein
MVSLFRLGHTLLSQPSSIGRETSHLRLRPLWGNLWVPQIGNKGSWWEGTLRATTRIPMKTLTQTHSKVMGGK